MAARVPLALVHGAFGGAWVWIPVVGVWIPVVGGLEQAGHRVETFDLPGSGEDVTPEERRRSKPSTDAAARSRSPGRCDRLHPAVATALQRRLSSDNNCREVLLLRPFVTGDTLTSELDRFVRRDGSIFPGFLRLGPARDAEGPGAVVTFTDIEDRLRADEARGEADANLRDELARLTGEQAALRRVATLVARGVPAADLFAAVAREVGLLVGGGATHIGRYEGEGTATVIASSEPDGRSRAHRHRGSHRRRERRRSRTVSRR